MFNEEIHAAEIKTIYSIDTLHIIQPQWQRVYTLYQGKPTTNHNE